MTYLEGLPREGYSLSKKKTWQFSIEKLHLNKQQDLLNNALWGPEWTCLAIMNSAMFGET